METEFLHDSEKFSIFDIQGSGLNLSGTFFEKVIDHEMAFRDDIPQEEDFWFSPNDEFGSSGLYPSALSLRGDGCDFSLTDLDPAFDASGIQLENLNKVDSWNSSSENLAGSPDFLSIKREIDEENSIREGNLLTHDDLFSDRKQIFPDEHGIPIDYDFVDVESLDAIPDVSKNQNVSQSFHPSSTVPSQHPRALQPPKPKPCSLLEAHLRSPIETIINAAHRKTSISNCTKQKNCRIVRESPSESINKLKSNVRKQKIPIIQAIPNKKLESASNRMIDAGRTLCRNKLIKLVTNGSTGETILLDHDYCSSSSKSSHSFASSHRDLETSKNFHDKKCQQEIITVSRSSVAVMTKKKPVSKNGAKTKPKVTENGSSGAPNFVSNEMPSRTEIRISKHKSCDSETALKKDISAATDIVQDSSRKNIGKSSKKPKSVLHCDSQIAQNGIATVKPKVSPKQTVMVSLLKESALYRDAKKSVPADDFVDAEKNCLQSRSSTSECVLAGPKNAKMCNNESQEETNGSNSSFSEIKESSNLKPNLSSAKTKPADKKLKGIGKDSIKPENAKSVPVIKECSINIFGPDVVTSRNSQPVKSGTEIEKPVKVDAKKLKQKTEKKSGELSIVELPSQSKNSNDSAKSNNNYDNHKFASNLTTRNSNVMVSVGNKIADSETVVTNVNEAGKACSSFPLQSKGRQTDENAIKAENIILTETSSKEVCAVEPPQTCDKSHPRSEGKDDNFAVSAVKVENSENQNLDPALNETTTAQNESKNISPEIDSCLKNKDESRKSQEQLHSYPKVAFAVNNHDSSLDVKLKMSKHQTVKMTIAYSNKPSKIEVHALEEAEQNHLNDRNVTSIDDCKAENDIISEDAANVMKKDEDSGFTLDSPCDDSLKQDENDGGAKLSRSSGSKRKLNLAEYRDRQRKRLDPGVSLTDKWVVPLIELDSSVTDPANRSSYIDLITGPEVSKPKIIESSSCRVEKVNGQGVSKTAKNDGSDVKTSQSKESLKQDKEITKRGSRSRDDRSDRSSRSSRRRRSSRSSSSSRSSCSSRRYRDRRRTPKSYRPYSRSSNSSSNSSRSRSRSKSRSRSHSKSRRYRDRSYKRSSYRRRSRDSDERSSDYYRYRSRDDKRRSKDERRRSREDRHRSREDKRRSRENSEGKKSYTRGDSACRDRVKSTISVVQSEGLYRPLHPRNFNISAQDKAIEEGRMIYVGKIRNTISRSSLRDRFEEFGPIEDISLQFRETRDSYAFITYKYAHDAMNAIEFGNGNKSLPQYDICYGGRRQVLSGSYSDLSELYGYTNLGYSPYDSVIDNSTSSRNVEEDSFDALLQDFRRAVSERTQKEV